MEDSLKKIKLTDVLQILESPPSENPIIFVNPEGGLETFFTYKGTIIEVGKMDIKLKLGTKPEAISEEIRGFLVSGLQKGEWIVFNIDKSSNFNFANFFKQLPINNGDADFFKNTKILDKNYLKSIGILKNEDDKDFFDNQGFYKVNDKARIFYLCTCNEEEIKNLKVNNSGINFEYILVE